MTHHGQRFRWVVVGGGAAGCWLARRLAESRSGSVALVEAGAAPRDPRTVVPAWYPLAQNSKLDWAYSTAPQSELGGRRLAWPRGKCLGGSSAINALIYMLPAHGDLERWKRIVGGWWLEALPGLAQRFDAAWQAPVGDSRICPLAQLTLEPVKETHAWCGAFLESATEMGLCEARGWIQSRPDVCGNYWLTAKHGRRQTTADALMRSQSGNRFQSSEQPGNVTLFQRCHVDRITIEQGRAVAVEVTAQCGARLSIHAEEEIVLTAGAIGSPALLLASGIGPAREIEQYAPECHVDSEHVGANLQDHLTLPIVLEMNTLAGLPYRVGPRGRARYRESGMGGLASNLAEVGAMLGHVTLPSASPEEAASTPRVQLHVTPTHYLKYPRLRRPTNCMSIAITPLHPESRGRLQLRGSAQHRHIHIDPQYLSRTSDSEDFKTAYAWICELISKSGLNRLVARQLIPAAHRSDPASIVRSVRALAQSIYHPVGTCRAGSDAGSVVDDRFRVRGVAGLRVADASVLPDLPSSNTCSATLLMSELAARAMLGSCDH